MYSHFSNPFNVLASLSVLFFAVGLKLVNAFNTSDSFARRLHLEYLMCVSCGLSLVQIFVLRLLPRGLSLDRSPANRRRLAAYAFRFGMCLLMCVVPAMTTDPLGSTVALFLLTLAIIFQV